MRRIGAEVFMSSPSRSRRNRGPLADEHHQRTVHQVLHDHGFVHLHVRRRAALLTLESGAENDRIPHARLRRVTSDLWQLEMATHTGRWQPTPINSSLQDVINTLIQDFGWTLQAIE